MLLLLLASSSVSSTENTFSTRNQAVVSEWIRVANHWNKLGLGRGQKVCFSRSNCGKHVEVACLQGKLGGGEGIEGLYGSITRSGMQKVLDSLVKNCSLRNESHIVDIGAGLGR